MYTLLEFYKHEKPWSECDEATLLTTIAGFLAFSRKLDPTVDRLRRFAIGALGSLYQSVEAG